MSQTVFQMAKQKSVNRNSGVEKYNIHQRGFPGGSDSKEPACNVGDPGLIPGSGRSPGEGKGYPLQYSGLQNPWRGHKESDMTERLSLGHPTNTNFFCSYIEQKI